MTRFVDTDTGLLNLDHVARITRRLAKGGVTFTFYEAAGTSLGSFTTAGGFDPETLTDPIIAAAPGAMAFVLTVYTFEGRPSESDIWTTELPIVAWRVGRLCAAPIFPEYPTDNAIVLLPMPDGSLLSVDDCSYPDLQHAKQAILGRFQGDWDRRHAARKMAPT